MGSGTDGVGDDIESDAMTLAQALAYLTPHPTTGANAPVLLTASKMREAIAVIRAALANPTPDTSKSGITSPTSGATTP